MSYVGGKARCSFILDILNHPAFNDVPYVEPFVGYGHVLRRVVHKSSYTASDNHQLLMCLLRAIQEHAPLPQHISRERYAELRTSSDVSVERAVAAFTYSFNGKCFAGYAPTYRRRNGRVDDQVHSRRNYYALLQHSEAFKNATLTCCDYASHTPHGAIVYADPPYQGTQGYGAPFDHGRFWHTMRLWSKHNTVLVSEYAAPTDWVCIAQASKQASLAGGNKQTVRTERLFVHSSALDRVAFLTPP